MTHGKLCKYCIEDEVRTEDVFVRGLWDETESLRTFHEHFNMSLTCVVSCINIFCSVSDCNVYTLYYAININQDLEELQTVEE